MTERTIAKTIPSRLARSLALGLCLLPPVVLAVLLWRDAVNVPYWDEWDDDSAGLFVKLKTGQLSFSDLWAQHTESRFVLLRIFVLLLGSLTHWNLDYEIAASFFLACVIACAVFWLGRPSFAGRPAAGWAVFFISSLLIFSPAQSEAWLWGMEIVLYLPLVCILFSLLVLRSKAGETAKWVSCAALAVVSTYSFCNGMLAWIVLFPVMFLAEGRDGFKKKSRAALCWLLAFFANAAVYFHDYNFPQSNGFWQMLWSDPWQVARYFFVFLGGPLVDRYSAHCLETATIIGMVLAVLFAAICLCLFCWRKHQPLTRLAWPWLAVGSYGILSALLATTGRSALGLEQALSPRYGIFGISLMVALAHLVPLLAFHSPAKNDFEKQNVSQPGFALAALGATVILLHALAFPSNVLNLSVFRLDLLLGNASLQFLDVLPPQPSATSFLFPNYATLKKNADALNQLGMRNDDLIKTTRLADFKLNPQPDCGGIESTQTVGGNIYLSGWALSASRKAAADCVLFTYESPEIKPVIFALMDSRFERAGLVAKFHDRAYVAAGWQKAIRPQDLPKGALTLKAWAYDVQTRQVTPLQNEFHLDNK
jgi:hypothetical protein